LKQPPPPRLRPTGLNTQSLLTRKSKVRVRDFAKVPDPKGGAAGLVDSLPDILAGRDFRTFLGLVRRARSAGKPVILGLGAHVIKVGLNPVIVHLMKEGWVNALALNGAGIIHDFEIAFSGQTSEDVAVQIEAGAFGTACETGEFLNQAIRSGDRRGRGLGEAVGAMIARSRFPHKDLSLMGTAFELGLPATVHVGIGTDTIHFHPGASGAALGRTSLRDFFRLCDVVESLEGGGVYLNMGSAVILPEVFLKALAYVRNQGRTVRDFSTAVFDFIYHYRPAQNVIARAVGTTRSWCRFWRPRFCPEPLSVWSAFDVPGPQSLVVFAQSGGDLLSLFDGPLLGPGGVDDIVRLPQSGGARHLGADPPESIGTFESVPRHEPPDLKFDGTIRDDDLVKKTGQARFHGQGRLGDKDPAAAELFKLPDGAAFSRHDQGVDD